jgi:hypothetical protein
MRPQPARNHILFQRQFFKHLPVVVAQKFGRDLRLRAVRELLADAVARRNNVLHLLLEVLL